jgi:hypothetical protein
VSRPPVHLSVLQTLTCPVCCEYMRPPITLCQAGHNICCRCRPSLQWPGGNKCPRCEGPLLDTRNVALETIARSLLYPCRYSVAGCRGKFGMDDIGQHHARCPHRSYDCPLRRLEGCKWTGRYHTAALSLPVTWVRLITRHSPPATLGVPSDATRSSFPCPKAVGSPLVSDLCQGARLPPPPATKTKSLQW